MNTQQLSQTIGRVVPFVALAVAIVTWLVAGPHRGTAALVGGGLSALNWLALSWLVGRATTGSTQARGIFMLLVVAKMGLTMAAVALLIRFSGLDALGLLIGLGVMFIGPLLGALLGAMGPAPTADAVGKER